MPTPSRAILCGGQPATSTPLMRTEPDVGLSTPRIAFITVDLPEPFGPMRPRISPGAMEKLMSRAAVRPPKRFESFSTSSAFMRPLASRRRGR